MCQGHQRRIYLLREYSNYRRREHGTSSKGIPNLRFVVCAQNHDQQGNRIEAERLSQLISFEVLKLAAGVLMILLFCRFCS